MRILNAYKHFRKAETHYLRAEGFENAITDED